MTIAARKWFCIVLPVIGLFVVSTSCYSVRLVSTHGTPMPCQTGIDIDCPDDLGNYYRDKRVVVIDTIVKAGLTADDIGMRVMRLGCETGKLFSVEYKNTFGGSLLYIITLGSKRKVSIKYVCMKPEN